MMPQAAPTPAPIHDIAGPWQIAGYPLGWVLAAAAAVIFLGLLLAWVFRGRPRRRPLTPLEKALAGLAALRADGGSAYECGVRVSDLLRTYIYEQHGLDAVHKTSIEFLESLRGNPTFSANETAALAAFLEASDLIKYARASAAAAELENIFDTAERLVRSGAAAKAKEGSGK